MSTAPVAIGTREVREIRVVDFYPLKADTGFEGVVTPDLAEVIGQVIGVLYARLRTVRTEPKGEEPSNCHDWNGRLCGILGSNTGEPIGRWIDGIHRLDRLEIKAGIAKAKFIQSGGRKSVRPGDCILVGVRLLILRKAGKRPTDKRYGIGARLGFPKTIEPECIIFADLVVDPIDILAMGAD